MSVQNLLILLLALVALAAVSAVAGLIGYSVSREGGSSASTAIGRGGFVFFSVMTLFIALLAVLVPAGVHRADRTPRPVRGPTTWPDRRVCAEAR